MELILVLIGAGLILVILKLTNVLSYTVIKNSIIKSKDWDLNICCGSTDGGGINADIIQHSDVENFILIKSIYDLPFEDNQFNNVICSHTLEHVDNPQQFYSELKRVSNELTILIPPLWDVSAALNFLEHKWIFLTFKSKHNSLPRFIKLPLSGWYQKRFGQRIKA